MKTLKSTQRKFLKYCLSEVKGVANIYIFIYSIEQVNQIKLTAISNELNLLKKLKLIKLKVITMVGSYSSIHFLTEKLISYNSKVITRVIATLVATPTLLRRQSCIYEGTYQTIERRSNPYFNYE